jgi:MFS superfamily sulfate permease-like transporter
MQKISFQHGLTSFKEHWKEDLLAGFSVSLIALPLCLGIAIASGFPPVAGIFAAVVGGLLVSRINGSYLTIAGPAAGLIVVNLGAIESLGGAWTENDPGGLPYALAAILIAGIIIALFGVVKVGKLGDFFPKAAVHGMLAAIGIIIIIKQLFPSLGTKAKGKEIVEVLAEIPEAFMNLDWKAAIIAGVSILLLILHTQLKVGWIKKIPAPLIVLLFAIPAAKILHLQGSSLVDLPNDIRKSIVLPDFGKITTLVFWTAVLTIALVSAIESILSALAVDQLDPKKRSSEFDQDLVGLGAGTAAAGAVGGLPMISEIVRSSANIGYGAKSQWSNFFHGLFLLIFMLVLKPVIELIPISALAGMLIFTGFRLASPSEFKHMWVTGKSEFMVFLTTCVVVLATDLLIGIGFGILLNMAIVVFKGQKWNNLFTLHAIDNEHELILSGSLTFTNYLPLKSKIQSNSDLDELILNFDGVQFIDHNAMHHIQTFQEDWKRKNKLLTFKGLEGLKPINELPSAERHRGMAKELPLSKRDIILQEYADKKGYHYNPGSVFGYEFKNFQLLSNMTISRAHNIIMSEEFQVADVQAVERLNLNGGEKNFTAFVMAKSNKPSFCLGPPNIFANLKDLLVPQEVRFESHPDFERKYLLTSTEEEKTRKLFSKDVLDYLMSHEDFKVEVNDQFILVFKDDKKMTTEEIDELIEFSSTLLAMFATNLSN